MRFCPSTFALLWLPLAACGSAPTIKVRSATELGTVKQSSLITGRDGGFGTKLFGQEVFMYGDTFVTQADVNGSSFHSNSFSITTDLDASDGIGGLMERTDAAGSPLLIIPNTPDEASFITMHMGDQCSVSPCGARWAMWPGSAVWDPVGQQALISYGLIYAEPGDFNFHGVGMSLAVWSDFNQVATRPTPKQCSDHPTLMFCQDEKSWGTALVLDGTMLNVFGCDKDTFTFHCRLARVPVAHALDRGQWQGWDGSTWTSLDAAATVFDASSIIRVYFNKRAGAWMVIYSGLISNNVMYRTAPALTGPWSDAAKLFTANHNAGGASDSGWTYDALVQPDYEEDGGRVEYVTYSRPNGTLFGSEFALVRVEFE